MRRSLLSAVTTLFALSALVATPSASIAGATAHVLRLASAEEVATLNPALNQQLVVSYLNQMTAASLFRLDAKNVLAPELAKVVPTQANGGISKDGLTVTVHLRTGVKWSDGAPFDADDVAFSIAAMNNTANNVVSRSGFDEIAKVDEPNKSTIVVHLRAPFGGIAYTLFASNQLSAVLPKHILGTLADFNHAPFNELPVGIGPFRYKAWRRGDQVELEANPYYWRGRPALAGVVLKLVPDRNTVLTQLQTGEIDLWFPFGGVFLPRVQAIPNVHVLRHPSYVVNQLLFNVSNPAVSDRVVRQALRYAIDRQELRDKVAHGVGILQNVVLPEVDPAVPKDITFTPFDLSKANALLDGAGWKRGNDGIRSKAGTRLSIDVAGGQGTPDADTQIELIRATFKQVGAELNVQRYQSSVLFGPYSAGGIMANGKFAVTFVGNDIEAPFDLRNSFGCKSFPPTGQNYMRYCNAQVEASIAAYERTYDESTRARILSNVLHVLDRDVVAITTTGREDLFGLSNSVKNFEPNNATPFDNMMRVDVVP